MFNSSIINSSEYEQLQIGMNESSPSPEPVAANPVGARAWRVFIECAFAIIDLLDTELRDARGLSLGWLDVLIHLEEAPAGLRMNELAEHILQSKSGLTRIVDRMSEEGLVRRERPEDDRRVVLVLLTDQGRATLAAARVVHRAGIQRHFLDHLTPADQATVVATLDGVRDHARQLRPGRVSH